VSSNPFRLDIGETGEQRFVTRTIPRSKAVSQIPAPFRRGVLHETLADIEIIWASEVRR
jgi:hypothetical protein